MRVLTRSIAGLILLGLLPLTGNCDDSGFYIRRAETRLQDGVYLMEARVSYRFSQPALEALDNGVPLTVLFEIDIERRRDYLWNETVTSLEQRYRLEYHALSDRYLVVNVNTGVSKPYQNLDTALERLGRLHDFPLLDGQLLKRGEQYFGKLKVLLDIEALPAPLRPLAYFSSSWRLSSETYRWTLQQH